MFATLEAPFNEGKWTLIGHPRSAGKPIEYSVVVLDDSMLCEPVGCGGKRMSDINGQRLIFNNSRRLDRKLVYWHYAISLMRHSNLQTDGIREKISNLVDGKAWGDVPGAWYEASMLKYMVEFWVDLARRSFDELKRGHCQEERAITKEDLRQEEKLCHDKRV
jgi:hypothetical protein